MLPNKRGNVGAQWHDAEMVGGAKSSRYGQVCGEALALKDRGTFNMVKDDTVRKAAIGEECAQPSTCASKALTFYVVSDGDAVEVQVHELPCAFPTFSFRK